MTSIILQTVAAIVTPLIVILALRFWWTGHYGPGGGFVGGLMVASAVLLLAMHNGGVLARRWDWLMALGLSLAVGSAIVPLLSGHAPMQHTVVYWPIKLASSLIFDAGVLLLVTGAMLSATRSLVEAP